MSTKNKPNDVCCPEFEPSKWDGKTFDWDQKHFIKARVKTFFYMPLNFGGVMKKLDARMKQAGASTPDWLCLSDHTSPWNMDLYVEVDKEIPDANHTQLAGKYACKVYEGPYKNTGKWQKDFKAFLQAISPDAGKTLMWYTTCPKCAKKYGKNYVALFGRTG